MRVIEDAQSKIPEGEYLAAMNALGALHRIVPGEPFAEIAAVASAPAPAPAPTADVVPQQAPSMDAYRRWKLQNRFWPCLKRTLRRLQWKLTHVGSCSSAPF